MQLKATLKVTITISVENEKEILCCENELCKLAEGTVVQYSIQYNLLAPVIDRSEQENKSLLDEKRRAETLLAKHRYCR